MRHRYPEIDPHDHGMLDVGDGQLVYWETCGNPVGKPAVVLHGGPGSGCSSSYRRWFDPAAYRIVLFDQRGCGRSLPNAGDPSTDLSANTTHHLIADIERLRAHLGVDRWLVWGASWGSTLALAYAERHPEALTEMVLVSVKMTRPADVRWLYHGVGRLLPEESERFRRGVSPGERDGDIVAAYHRLVNDRDSAVRERAARDWCDWEDAITSLEPGGEHNPRYDAPGFRMTFARIVTHYFHHAAWLEDGELLRDAERLEGIPGVLVHGLFDVGSPPIVAWEVARAWPGAELRYVRTGHAGGDEMTDAAIEATDRFATEGRIASSRG